MSTIEEICTRMLDEGYEYGSLVQTLTLDQYKTSPEAMGIPWIKPMAPTLACSRIDRYEEDDGETKVALQWAEWVIDQEFEIPKYEASHLFFPKVDETSLATQTDPRFGKGGVWRHETQFMPVINWSKVARTYAGIKVDPCEMGNSDVFQMYDVDSKLIWDVTNGVKEGYFFENAGKFLYNPVPILYNPAKYENRDILAICDHTCIQEMSVFENVGEWLNNPVSVGEDLYYGLE